ncbi:MAG TPA: tRNA (adenosine(37)-N6)-dimethylallyltransferase MiaA [Bacteroidia bacterium]
MKKNKHLIVIAGPTAIGKTALGADLAKEFRTDVISADSRQFFREMSIGTAKPSKAEMSDITHHFIGSHSISENYNVGKFESDVISLLDELFLDKDVVIMVGGSGLYIDAVCKGFDELPEADPMIREQIDALLLDKGIEGLREKLKELDPEYYAQVDLGNPQRLSRAIEVCISSGKTYSSLRAGRIKERNFNIIKIGLNTDRGKLYDRINERVDRMMENGLLEEVRSLVQYKNANALQTVGYKELFDHLDGKTDLQSAVELIRQNTRKFAKRQLTWFRRDKNMKWFEPDEKEEIIEYIKQNIF